MWRKYLGKESIDFKFPEMSNIGDIEKNVFVFDVCGTSKQNIFVKKNVMWTLFEYVLGRFF